MKKLIDFLRSQAVGLLIGAVGMTGTAFFTRQQFEFERLQTMKVEEFNRFMEEKQKFNEALQQFSFDLSQGKVDKSKIGDMSTSLVRQYANADAFSVNVPVAQEASLAAYKSSLADVKASLQSVKGKKDLVPLGTSVLNMERQFKVIRPIMEAVVGKPDRL